MAYEKNQLIQDNYRLSNAIKELCKSLQFYNKHHEVHSWFILMAGDCKDNIFADNGIQMNLTTPILISRLKLMIKRLEE